MVFAVREPGDERRAARACPSCGARASATRDARALLASALHGPLDERVRDRIVAETRGNPLALLELPRGLTAAELAGGFGLPDASALSRPDRGELRAAPRRRCPRETRAALLIAAAEPVGDPLCLARGRALGSAPTRRRPAMAAGPARVRRRRCGSAIRWCAPRSTGRRRRPSASACTARSPRPPTPRLDPDRRAWHRAQAAAGPRRGRRRRARALGRPRAGARRARGGRGVPRAGRRADAGPGARARRALAAAQAKHQAGAPDAALRLLGAGRGRPARRARSARGRSCCAPRSRSPSRTAATRRRCCSTPPGGSSRSTPTLARETYLDAFSAALLRRPPRDGGGVREVGEAVRAATGPRVAGGRRARATCSSTAWRVLVTRGLRGRRADAASGRSARSATSRCPSEDGAALAVARAAAWPAPSGTTRAGTSSTDAPGRGSPASRRARAAAARAHRRASACSCSRASSPRRRRSPPRRTRSSRRRAAG